MKTTESVNDFVMERTVGIMVEPMAPRSVPSLFMSFAVEIAGTWFLVTAAHCAQAIDELLGHWPNAAIVLLTFTDLEGRPRRTPIARKSWEYVDIQRTFRRIFDSAPEAGIDPKEADHFDLAIWQIPDTEVCYFINERVKPFKEKEVLADEGDMARLLAGETVLLSVTGFPARNQRAIPSEKTLVCEFRTFPLHPNPDGDTTQGERRVEVQNPQCIWIPTNWTESEWEGHVRGISGGPVTLMSGGEHHLVGIATHQRPGGDRHPTHIAVCSVYSILMAIRDHILAPAPA